MTLMKFWEGYRPRRRSWVKWGISKSPPLEQWGCHTTGSETASAHQPGTNRSQLLPASLESSRVMFKTTTQVLCLHNQRGLWDCYGLVCQSVFQIVSHSLWSTACAEEEKKKAHQKLIYICFQWIWIRWLLKKNKERFHKMTRYKEPSNHDTNEPKVEKVC